MPNQSSCRTSSFYLLFIAVQRAVKCEISFGKSLLDLELDKMEQSEGKSLTLSIVLQKLTFHRLHTDTNYYMYTFFPVLHYLEGAAAENRDTPSVTWQTGTAVFWKCSARASFKTEPWDP